MLLFFYNHKNILNYLWFAEKALWVRVGDRREETVEMGT